MQVADELSAPPRRRGGRRSGDQTTIAEHHIRVTALHQVVRRELLEAREAVALLRDELASVGRSYAEPAFALQNRRIAYAATIRRELSAAEARLLSLRNQRQDVLRELRRVRDAVASEAARNPNGRPPGASP